MTNQSIKLLRYLMSCGSHIPEDDILLGAELSSEAFEASLVELESLGCEIGRGEGVTLVGTSLEVWADYIEYFHAGGIGYKLHLYRKTGSTQNIAKQIIAGGNGVGHVVVADEQSDGRGRLGRRWEAGAGECLLLTVIIDQKEVALDHMMLASCCAVASTIEKYLGRQVQIRWPNDIMIQDLKLAGILVELSDDKAMIGIGLNVRLDRERLPEELKGIVGSMHELCEMPDRLLILDDLLTQLTESLQTESKVLKQWWYERSTLFEKRVTVECDGREYTGRVVDLDTEAGLMIAVDHGPITIFPAATTSLLTK